MRIAIFPDEYLPESTRVHAKMLHELALELKKLGNEVVVITPGDPKQQTLLSVCFLDGIEVWRFRSGTIRGRGKVIRAVNESLLSIRAWLAIQPKLKSRSIDLCINYSPSIFFGFLMKKIKKQSNAYIYLILRDIFPQWVIDEGILYKHSPIAYYFKYFEHVNYKVSNKIALMSQSNLEYFNNEYPNYKKTTILSNWCNESIGEANHDIPFNVREELGLVDEIIYFYGGNMGHAQNMDNLIALARSMQDEESAHFLFIGQGDDAEKVKSKSENMKNVSFLSSISQNQYEQVLSQVDIGMISLAKSHKINNHPGKILGYLKYKLPILGIINDNNDLIELINFREAGYLHQSSEGIRELRSSAIKLLKSYNMRKKIGENGRALLTEKFSVKNAARQIINELN